MISDKLDRDQNSSNSDIHYSIRLEDVRNPHRVFSCGMKRGSARLGRQKEGNQLVIEDDHSVSRVHCEFRIKDDKCYVRDLDSTNGTFIDQNRIPAGSDIPIESRSVIKIGIATYQITITNDNNTQKYRGPHLHIDYEAEDTPLSFDYKLFDRFYSDLKNNKLPNIPDPTDEDINNYLGDHADDWLQCFDYDLTSKPPGTIVRG